LETHITTGTVAARIINGIGFTYWGSVNYRIVISGDGIREALFLAKKEE